MDEEQKRLHFPAAETSAEFLDLPSHEQRRSQPHTAQERSKMRYKARNNKKTENEENQRKNEHS